ncbi:MAG: RNA polymerase sigma factor [Planctomycetes bacterium]|nr:RNA polymerase sigma factor [Planctomycetota bacterium]
MPARLDIAACFEAHRARVYRWAHGLCRRHDLALDVVQDVFARLIESAPAAENEGALIGWLRCVTDRLVIDRWRTAAARRKALAGAAVRPATADAPDAEAAAAVRAALLELSPQQRLVIIAKFYDDLTFEQIAAELGVAASTAKTHYLRALETLRRRLDNGIRARSSP